MVSEFSKVYEKVFPGMNSELSNIPASPFSVVPLVTVWATESLFVQVTSPSISTVTSYGTKHSFVFSHPEIEMPDGILTEYVVAKAGTMNIGIRQIATITKILMPNLVLFSVF